MSPALIPTQKSPCEPSSSAQDGTMLSSSISSVTCDSPAPIPGPTDSTEPDLEHALRRHWRAVADALVLLSLVSACVEGWNGTFNIGGRSVRIRKGTRGDSCHLDQNGTSQTRRNANSAPMRHTLLELKTCSESWQANGGV